MAAAADGRMLMVSSRCIFTSLIYKYLNIASKDVTICKDCGIETEPGPGSARCPQCWEDRCGH